MLLCFVTLAAATTLAAAAPFLPADDAEMDAGLGVASPFKRNIDEVSEEEGTAKKRRRRTIYDLNAMNENRFVLKTLRDQFKREADKEAFNDDEDNMVDVGYDNARPNGGAPTDKERNAGDEDAKAGNAALKNVDASLDGADRESDLDSARKQSADKGLMTNFGDGFGAAFNSKMKREMEDAFKPVAKKLVTLGDKIADVKKDNYDFDSGVKQDKEGDWDKKSRERMLKRHEKGVEQYKVGATEIKDKETEDEKRHQMAKEFVSVSGSDPETEKNGNFFRSVQTAKKFESQWSTGKKDKGFPTGFGQQVFQLDRRTMRDFDGVSKFKQADQAKGVRLKAADDISPFRSRHESILLRLFPPALLNRRDDKKRWRRFLARKRL